MSIFEMLSECKYNVQFPTNNNTELYLATTKNLSLSMLYN